MALVFVMKQGGERFAGEDL